MKKLVLAGLAAVLVMGISQQQASAWVNSKFSVGLNWGFQSGGNQLLWGAWRNGQPPGPEAFGGGGGHMPQYFAPMPGPASQGYAPMQQGFAPMPQATYAPQYGSPYQFANYPRPVYYYSAPTYYYYYGR
ncbi:MAG: hypothetical protein HYX68_17915 [Planctomycetes bacterium]|nr:hypothetical protein [Planctomycetota bacterium]